MFKDRTDAGRQLADLLADRDVEADVVLGIPRGGLPVARAVADALGAPLDVVVASKLGAPDSPELAIGAVASDGSLWRNEDLIDQLGVDEAYVERERDAETEAAREKLERYRGTADLPDLADKRVVVVDDGLATGATTIAALRQVRAAGADSVVLAVPVGSPDAVERLRAEADDVVAVETPPHFSAVGQFYRSFDQISDEEAMAYLDR
ncbi:MULTISPECIES: phosphoribosyltransferase [Halorussus]|uniref:phosphoribosyltransferase n=1 Tax=Halorussus TaxID=1070314 RepID=UPI000E20F4DE|nr:MULTISPECIES: phosphoribosyltransferase family protein [Halorussus]NHN61388.1 phosphoribosyltransferase [Halorussus sp. JP-T4]